MKACALPRVYNILEADELLGVIVNWLMQNKEWIFSGIGVSALVGILGVFAIYRKKEEGDKRYLDYGYVVQIIFLVVLFLTNPEKADHINYLMEDLPTLEDDYKIRYIDVFIFSIAYTNNPLCKKYAAGKIIFQHCADDSNNIRFLSYGMLGKILPTGNFRYLAE